VAKVGIRDQRHLTLTERRLLELLVANSGGIVTHEELLEAMTSVHPSDSIGNLRTYIFRLRKKLEVDPALPNVIITHRGEGYSFAGKERARRFPEDES
jgi:two-component system KDP operon response regulator KdpE